MLEGLALVWGRLSIPAGHFIETGSELIQTPIARELPPSPMSAFASRRPGSGAFAVHRRDRAEHPQRVRPARRSGPPSSAASRVPYRLQQARRARRADARRARQLVGRIAAERDEIRHLLGLDAIAVANLGRTDPVHLAGAHGKEDRRALRRRAETCRGRRSPPAPCRRASSPPRRPRRENHPPHSRRPWHSRSRRPRRTPAGRRAARAAPGRILGRSGRRETASADRSASSACPTRRARRAAAPRDRAAAGDWRSRRSRPPACCPRAGSSSAARDRSDGRRNPRR